MILHTQLLVQLIVDSMFLMIKNNEDAHRQTLSLSI